MSDTMLDLLRERGKQICREGCRLLREFSGMQPVNTPDSPLFFIDPDGDQYWRDLPPEGKQVQSQLLPEIDRFTELISALTQTLPSGSQGKLAQALVKIRAAVEQGGTTWWKTTNGAVEGFEGLVNEVLSTLEEHYGLSEGTVLAVPDTNALLDNPNIEEWQFEDGSQFTLILTPTVLSELDRLKVNHRNPDVRDTAKALIRKIKEYRRRGSLLQGVTIMDERILLRSIASEPNISQSLPWFDSTNADDRFLATALEVIRAHMGAKVLVVTSDINMQNKAEMAGIPFSEVPTQGTAQENG